MRSYLRGTLACVSVLIFVVAVNGYWMSVFCARTSVPNVSVPSQLGLGNGRIFILINPSDHVSSSRWVYDIKVPGPRPELNWLWRFDAGADSNQYFILLPIWCVLVPCSIAPILWVRKRRRLGKQGFPVEPATGDSQKSVSSV